MRPSERYGCDPEFAALVDRAAAQAGDTAAEALRGLDEFVVSTQSPTNGDISFADLMREDVARRQPPIRTARRTIPPWARQRVKR